MALVITTTSCTNQTQWEADRNNAIYPAFVDNLPYWAYANEVSLESSETDYFQLKASGGTTYSWTLVSGSLPPGLSFGKDSATDGKIHGTPTKEGTYTFTVQVSSPGQASVQKTLSMLADFWRAKWLRDARTTITTHWGKMSGPISILNTQDPVTNVINTHISEWEARSTQYNVVAYADQMEEWGMNVLEVSPVWQNRALTWPSTTPTRYHDHSTRDFLGENITEFHSRGMKVLGYFAADSQFYGTPPNILTDGDSPYGNWGGPNIGAIRELVRDKKLDGFVFDIGAAIEVPGVNPGWLSRTAMIASIRFLNPWCIFGINPGVRDHGLRVGGTLIAYPHCDFVIFESVKSKSTSEALLELGIPSAAQKKMAIYAWQQISSSWGYGPDSDTDPLKNIDGIRRNMSKNWNAGATMSCGLPVKDTGLFVDDHFRETFDEIGEYHKANKNFSEDPQISYANGFITITTASKARIFYTLDGTEPNTSSLIYMKPIPVATNTKIRVRTLQRGKAIGYIQDFDVESLPAVESQILFASVPNDVNRAEDEDESYYRGMLITVGQTPIEITGIGRKVAGSMTKDHDVIIRRRWDEYPMYVGSIKTTDALEGQYKFANIASIRLEAGQKYLIACKEDDTEQYASNSFLTIPTMPYVEIRSSFMLSHLGDLFPIVQDNIGQFLNIKYRALVLERSANVLLGSKNAFISNITGGPLEPSASVYFADNATNGDDVSMAIAGGEYGYTLKCDAGEPYEISKVHIQFGEGYATEFELLASLSDQLPSATSVLRIYDNTAHVLDLSFARITARCLFLKAIKPDDAGQPGGQMSVIKFEAYK